MIAGWRSAIASAVRASSHGDSAVIMIALAFLLATNNYYSLREAILDVGQTDAAGFWHIASVAPEISESVAPHRLQRFAVPYSLGLLSTATGLDHTTVFRAGVIVLTVVTLALLLGLLRTIGLDPPTRRTLLLLFALHPSAFRYYLAVPWMITDLAFVAGLALLLNGLVTVRPAAVLLSSAVMVLSRQNALLVLPVALVWMTRVPEWRTTLAPARRALYAGTATVIVLAGFALTYVVSLRAGRAPALALHAIGITEWLHAPPDNVMIAVANLVLRPFAQMLPLVVFSVLAATIAWRRGARLRLDASLAAATALLLWLQPMAAGSIGNSVRLVALGILPAITCLALVIPGADVLGHLSEKRLLALVGIAAVASFHHNWSWVGASLFTAPAGLMGVQLAAATAVTLIMTYGTKAPPFFDTPA